MVNLYTPYVRTINKNGFVEYLTLERTADRKLNICAEQVGTIPHITTQVGLSEEGELQIERVDAEYIESSYIAEPGVVERDTILTDTLAVISKQELGEGVLQSFLNAYPFDQQ